LSINLNKARVKKLYLVESMKENIEMFIFFLIKMVAFVKRFMYLHKNSAAESISN
jgi:hypothetical protein